MLYEKYFKIGLIAVNLLIAGLLVGRGFKAASVSSQESPSTPISLSRPNEGAVSFRSPQNVMGAVDDPLEMNLKIGDRSLPIKKAMSQMSDIESPDWLLNMEVELKNTSNKVINHIVIDIIVPFKENGGRAGKNGEEFIMYRMLYYGKDTRAPQAVATERLLPGEKVTARVDIGRYKIWLKTLLKQGVDSISKIEIMINQVNYEDGTYWFSGGVFPLK